MRSLILVGGVIVGMLLIAAFPVSGADEDIAQQYAPIWYFEAEESCYPVDISYGIENSQLYLFSDDGSQLIEAQPTAESIALYTTDDYFLDNVKGTIDDKNIIADYTSQQSSLGYTVYAHVVHQGATTIVQYWVYYVFNDGPLNIHEGDWEMIQIVLTNDEPTHAMVSQHHSGQQAPWEQTDHEDNHIKVYVARGTHANYLRSYSGVLGVANDVVGSNGEILEPDEYSLVMLTNQSWLSYGGRWGAYGSIEDEVRGRVGPVGPQFRGDAVMWNDPLQWGESLPALDNNILMIEWILYHFLTIYISLTALGVLILAGVLYRRHKKHGLGPRILSLLYIDGVNASSIGNILCIVALIIAFLGITQQWYGVAMEMDIPGYDSYSLTDVLLIDGMHGLQLNMLDNQGTIVQMGNVALPFALLIGIGLVFFVLGTIGVAKSNKLGRKYLYRGIRLFVLILLIIIAIMSAGMFVDTSMIPEGDSVPLVDLFQALSAEPFGGSYTMSVEVPDGQQASVFFNWGIRQGGLLILLAGMIMIIAGIMEIITMKQFFTPKKPQPVKSPKNKKQKKGKRTLNDDIIEQREE